MRIRHFFSAAFLVLSVTTLAFAASADVAGAQGFVEKEEGQIRRLVEANAPNEQVRTAIDSMVDYEELARRTMGAPCPLTVPSCTNHWKDLNDDQRREVTGLLRQLVEKNTKKNINKTRDYNVTYRGAREQADNLSKIRTEAKSKTKPRDPAIQVDYVVMGMGNGYKVIDIVTEGSSMTKNYYDQFHRMLTNSSQGYPYLVEKLRKKVAKREKE